MAEMLDKFIEELKKAYGENLKSALLYGSKASGEDVGKHSDYNVLLILGTVRFEDLSAADRVLASWVRNGNPPPLLFTEAMFRNSADVFPIEFLDMRDNHRMLSGDDPFVTLEIADTHLRHECEFELKGKLLKLRQGYMAAFGDAKKVRSLLMSSLPSLLVVFRHVLRLLRETPPSKKMEALSLLARRTGMDAEVFAVIDQMRHSDAAALKLDADEVMRRYLLAVEQVVDIVDRMDTEYKA